MQGVLVNDGHTARKGAWFTGRNELDQHFGIEAQSKISMVYETARMGIAATLAAIKRTAEAGRQ